MYACVSQEKDYSFHQIQFQSKRWCFVLTIPSCKGAREKPRCGLPSRGRPYFISLSGPYHLVPVFLYLPLNKFFVFIILSFKNFCLVRKYFCLLHSGYFWFLQLLTLKPCFNWSINHLFILSEVPVKSSGIRQLYSNLDLPPTCCVPLGKSTFLTLIWKAKMLIVLTSYVYCEN